MEFSVREQKLIRLAFDPFTTFPENENAWLKLLNSLKNRGVTGYQLAEFKTGYGQLFDKSAYFAELGRKTRGTKQACERARKAATARWNKRNVRN